MLTALPIYNGLVPAGGPKALLVPFAFTLAIPLISGTIQLEQSQNIIDKIQSVFIDNSLNLAPFIITFGGTQKISVQPSRQGIYPVLCPEPLTFVAQSSAIVTVQTMFLNMPMAFAEWNY